jgi:cell division cycle 20-like protein 1 (cofactor of APC complex)
LDAPSLQDDFYLNLVDWSSQNTLAVALASCVYLWSATNNKVTKFCDLGVSDSVTSITWNPRGTSLSIGTSLGETQVWDAVKLKRVMTYGGHTARVGSLAWSNHLLSSGSRDKSILYHDVRVDSPYVNKLIAHKQEVCGL